MNADIGKMLAAFAGGKTDEQIMLYLDVAKKFTTEVVSETCERFIFGKVKRSNHSFAPSVPEFQNEAQSVADWHKAKSQKHTPLKIVPHTPLEDRLASFRRIYAGRETIEENVDSTRWFKGCQRRHWPAGASYCAALGTVFAPVRQQGRAAE